MLLSADRWDQARSQFHELVERYERDPAKHRAALMDAKLCLAMLLRDRGRPEEAEPLLREVLRRTDDVDQVSLARLVLRNRHGPGLADSPSAPPSAPLVLDAPYRAASPVADGRVEPGEYGPGLDVDFTDTGNPGRLMAIDGGDLKKGRYATKDAADLSYRASAAHTDTALYIAVEVRDQFIDDQEWDRAQPHFNDSVELFINGDLAANDFMPLMPITGGVGFRGNREGFHVISDAAGGRASSSRDFSDADWRSSARRAPGGYVVEFEFPLGLIDTKDGPGAVPAATGSFLMMNVAVSDNDEPVSEQSRYGTLWNDGEPRGISLYALGEDTWNVGLRLTAGK